MKQTPINIAIFDDHQILASGLATILSNRGYSISFVASNKETLFSALAIHQNTTILIADVVLPDVSGLDVFKELQALHPLLKTIAYTSLNSAMLVENLLLFDVKGFVNKRQPEEELIKAIEAVAKHKIHVPTAYEFLIRKISTHPNHIELSEREKQVLMLIKKGKLSKEIALHLGVSKNTIDNQRASLFNKLKVQNVVELIKVAEQLGY